MYLVTSYSPSPNPELDPTTMRRRAIIAAALGLPATALPSWAASAATTPDGDHTLTRASFDDAYGAAWNELEQLGTQYVTHTGALNRHTICETGLWLYSQVHLLSQKAPLAHRRKVRRLSAEAAMFTGGCYLDLGNTKAAIEMYSRAHNLCQDTDYDLRAFIGAQANWVPMYDGRWQAVYQRSEGVIREAEAHGGYGLLMGYTHLARAQAVLGNKDGARESLARAQANIARVPGARAPHTALAYTATKVWFSSATAYAELGDTDRQAEAQHHALEDPTLGWIDENLMKLAQIQTDPDPEHAARRIRVMLAGLPQDSFNHCVKAEAQRITGRLKARQITRNAFGGQAGAEVRCLGQYLSSVKVA